VLARSERPTVERVRLELGRGSPARVGGFLDQWWTRLAERLSGETRQPALPKEVSQAFVAVWQQAIHLAQGVAEQAQAEQRQVLATERESPRPRITRARTQYRLASTSRWCRPALCRLAQWKQLSTRARNLMRLRLDEARALKSANNGLGT
jgi:hypothetical protein